MTNQKIFGVQNSNDLFGVIVKRYQEFEKHPNEADFLFLCFALYHLREWVVEGLSFKEIKNIPNKEKTKEQNLFVQLYEMKEFQIVGNFCNTGKHFSIGKTPLPETRKAPGAAAGVLRAGDSLDSSRVAFQIGQSDARDIFIPLIRAYSECLNN